MPSPKSNPWVDSDPRAEEFQNIFSNTSVVPVVPSCLPIPISKRPLQDHRQHSSHGSDLASPCRGSWFDTQLQFFPPFPLQPVFCFAHILTFSVQNFDRSLCCASLLPTPDPIRKFLVPCSFSHLRKINPTSLRIVVATQTHSHLFSARGR